jgi:hypothetical protein
MWFVFNSLVSLSLYSLSTYWMKLVLYFKILSMLRNIQVRLIPHFVQRKYEKFVTHNPYLFWWVFPQMQTLWPWEWWPGGHYDLLRWRHTQLVRSLALAPGCWARTRAQRRTLCTVAVPGPRAGYPDRSVGRVRRAARGALCLGTRTTHSPPTWSAEAGRRRTQLRTAPPDHHCSCSAEYSPLGAAAFL